MLWYQVLHLAVRSLRPPFNESARAEAGFDKAWYEPLVEKSRGVAAARKQAQEEQRAQAAQAQEEQRAQAAQAQAAGA
eukprot:366147-Chlamydomonas_euryale.AAC.7